MITFITYTNTVLDGLAAMHDDGDWCESAVLIQAPSLKDALDFVDAYNAEEGSCCSDEVTFYGHNLEVLPKWENRPKGTSHTWEECQFFMGHGYFPV
jgi:hypothetical protein